MATPSFFHDRTGKLVGSVTTESNGKKTYLDSKGALVARTHDAKTFDKKCAFVGKGDQGLRLFK